MINKRFILPSIVLVVVAGGLSGGRNSTNKELPESPAVGYSIRNKYTELVVRTLDKKVLCARGDTSTLDTGLPPVIPGTERLYAITHGVLGVMVQACRNQGGIAP